MSSRLVLLIATAAVAPLLIYGLVSIQSVKVATRQSVTDGNLNVARHAANQIDLYIATNIKILQALAADLQNTALAPWQQERIVRNFVLRFPEFREITLFDMRGTVVASSRIGPPRLSPPDRQPPSGSDVLVEPVSVDDDLLPSTHIVVPAASAAGTPMSLVGQLNLVELWTIVDQIRIGTRGFALLIAADGRLVAHGDPNQKTRIARGDKVLDHPLLQKLSAGGAGVVLAQEFENGNGDETLAVGAQTRTLGWTLIVEQPVREAYGIASQIGGQLTIAIGLALLITLTVGYLWGRSFIGPIAVLIRATRALAEGQLDARVRIQGGSEFRELGEAFNSMADRLVELQEDVRKQERQAMFGRIAAGLVHDVSHPIQNIGNSCKLILKMADDEEYRQTFKRTVDRELAAIKRVLEDLRNLARPIPLERFPLDIARVASDVVESMQPHAHIAGVSLEASAPGDSIYIEGDLFGLGRVARNLIINAIQATPPGGRIVVSVERRDRWAALRVADTGCGIPPNRLGAIFDDFVTTKRRGLGLGLAICKKIVEQLGGRISVASEVGKGTAFEVVFETTEARPVAAAS